jgi:predicted porin
MKKWLTLVSGVASACAFNAAYGQSSVALYGVIDNGIEYQNAGSGGAVRATSGGLFASRYGLKGSEDIGNGLHINFQLEQGFNGATGAAASATAAFNRQAWVGLSGDFGDADRSAEYAAVHLPEPRTRPAVGHEYRLADEQLQHPDRSRK